MLSEARLTRVSGEVTCLGPFARLGFEPCGAYLYVSRAAEVLYDVLMPG